MEYRKLGKFQFEKSVASGGMGEIIKSVDEAGHVYALKKILKEHQDNPKFRELFKREAEITFSLDHPNIVKVRGFDRVGHQLVLALEYLDGVDLRQLLGKLYESKKITPAVVVIEIVKKILKGLHYAHHKKDKLGRSLGIIHRDLNPSNIFITYSGEVKILDFGISKATEKSVHNLTPKGEMRGKMSYLAPEQLKDKEIDSRVDIFAAGIVLWELLTLTPLFPKDTLGETFEAILSGKIPSVYSVRSDLPPGLDLILNKALHLDPKQRFSTAGDFERALDKFLRANYPVNCSARELSIYVKTLFQPEGFNSTDPLYLSGFGWLLTQMPGLEEKGFTILQDLVEEHSTMPYTQLCYARALLSSGQRLEGMRALRRLARVDSIENEVQDLLVWLGVRREPVIKFLDRSNPLNHALGRIRHRFLGPTPFQQQFAAA